MDLNFDRLRKIYLESGEIGLAAEKQRLLDEYIQNLPEDKKQWALEYDKKLQTEFIGLTVEQRLLKLSGMIQDHLFDLTNAMIDINTEVNGSVEANNLINKVKRNE